ncbi:MULTISPECIES: vWA domain-containing protein [unclassified Modicisalibacter]|uniref:vWA domain-containing protein n=1 Tax=unclassified Modicisalibacter TaxID=2679913 RepID=UPI001CCB9CA8|nr:MULTISPECIES: vWA domain-containing protein [unclassified Modicisalibacter]MBZ9560401.1 VWA domain-containing protein [Modicisalibacter sp. R2A 31.J]MBZ9576310.1 VWA domain-containing protein [Modicisalibacter sp. MOD 31.J]
MQWLMTAALALSLLVNATARAQAPDTADVRLVFDVSGSMKQNDPNRLSASALELIVTLLPSGARGGLWTFGSEVANPLPPTTIDDAWRQRALSLKPALLDYQQYTDIERAVRQAADAPPTDGKRHLILLTDGMVDTPGGADKAARDEASRKRLIDELAPVLHDDDVVVHTIAFSPNVDLDLLENLAQKTQGLTAVAEDPEALLRAFLDVFDRIFPRDQVPLEAGSFPIDERVDAFSSLLFHGPQAPPLALIAPDGTRYTVDDHPDDVRWQHQPLFDIIHMPAPIAGQWRVEGEVGPDSRISVESPLALRTRELPTTLYQGFETPIEAWLTRPDGGVGEGEGGSPVSLRAELRDIDGRVRQTVPLTAQGDHYRGVLAPPEQAGNARLVVVAENDDFIRERRQAVNVLSPIAARVVGDNARVDLHAEHPRLDVDNTQLTATLQGQMLDVVPQGDRNWRIDLPDVARGVAVPLTVWARVTLDGETRRFTLPEVTLNPGAATSLHGVSLDRPGGHIETLDEEEEQQAAPPSSSLDRLGDSVDQWLDALPSGVRSLWQAAPPPFRDYVASHRHDPLAWALLIAGLLVAILLPVGLRRRRHRQRATRREEPHV